MGQEGVPFGTVGCEPDSSVLNSSPASGDDICALFFSCPSRVFGCQFNYLSGCPFRTLVTFLFAIAVTILSPPLPPV